MRSILNFSVNVETPTILVATPERREIVNSFDFNAGTVGVTRVNGESNAELRDRIFDASVNPSGPLYENVVNGITRDLGLLKQPCFSIDLKLNSNGLPVAESPRVDIHSNRVVLYSDWRPNGTAIVDREIYFYKPDSDGFYIENLCTEINSSEYFSATLYDGVRPNTHSASIIKRTSNVFMPSELIRSDKRTLLSYRYLSKDSITFDDKETFSIETIEDPSSIGEYLVDYNNGIISCYTIPEDGKGCSYHANIFPLEVDYSPVQIFSLNNEDFVSELFDKETLDSGEEINSLLNDEGSQIYHQLFLESKVFWGK